MIHSSSWDKDAELYLRNVINRDGGLRDGGVPCAWPTIIFEVSRVSPNYVTLVQSRFSSIHKVISTLAIVGVSPNPPEALSFAGLLNDTLAGQNGLLGFGEFSISKSVTSRSFGSDSGSEENIGGKRADRLLPSPWNLA